MDQALTEKAHERPQPSAYKDYNAHPFFALPNPLQDTPTPEAASGFLDVLLRRRSLRAFTPEPLNANELSALLYYVWGATCVQRNHLGDVFLHKTAPAGGSLQGAEVYPILMNVEGFAPGVYHYSVRRHGLVLLSQENPRPWIAAACGDQAWIADAAAVFLSTYNVKRLAWKYAFSRGFRAALLDTGHLGQSFALVSTWLGLAPFTTAALRDELFEDKLGLDYRAEPVLMVNGVGRPADAPWLPDRPPKA
jgi:SagB-type dehydrogenase family enzyme